MNRQVDQEWYVTTETQSRKRPVQDVPPRSHQSDGRESE